MTTTSHPEAPPRKPGCEPLPGYRLVERLGSGGYGEVWRCVAPGGLPKAIKFVRSPDPDNEKLALTQELDALERVKALRHPYLLGLDRVEILGAQLLLVMELADMTLLDRLGECSAVGLPGISREEFLPLALEAAEALDLLASHGLQHLDVKPANLFLVGGHLKVGDFSLVGRIGGARPPAADTLAGITAKYVSPEVLRGQVSPKADQYGLALVTYELLTGRFPYPARSARTMVVQHVSGTPDLSATQPTEAAIIGRALAKDPNERFASCREFIRKLADSRVASGAIPMFQPRYVPPAPQEDMPELEETTLAVLTADTTPPQSPLAPKSPVREFSDMGRPVEGIPPGRSIDDLMRVMIRVCLLGATDVPGENGGDVTDLFCRFPVDAERSALTAKLLRFASRWKATPEDVKGGTCVLWVDPPSGWLRRLFDQPEPIKLVVTLPPRRSAGRSEVTAVALGCAGRKDPERHGIAVTMLANLRLALADEPEARKAARYPVDEPVVVYPVAADGRVGPGVEARCVDLSLGGARIELARDVPDEHLYIRFPNHPTAARYGVLGTIVRRTQGVEGNVTYGCRFATS